VITKGTKVTKQPRRYHDGTPVAGWPDPQFVGEVLKLVPAHGLQYARVKYPSGRTSLENIETLTEITIAKIVR
jgi:hypothetical protein